MDEPTDKQMNNEEKSAGKNKSKIFSKTHVLASMQEGASKVAQSPNVNPSSSSSSLTLKILCSDAIAICHAPLSPIPFLCISMEVQAFKHNMA